MAEKQKLGVAVADILPIEWGSSFNQELMNKILGNINKKLPQKLFQPILFVLRPKSKVSLKYITWPALKQNAGSTPTDHCKAIADFGKFLFFSLHYIIINFIT